MIDKVEDTYAEAFDGVFSRLLITAKDEKRLKRAAYSSTALPLTVLGGSEGGVEQWVDEKNTPDGRKGAIIQIWVNAGKKALENLEIELGKRIRQGILVVPTTTVFNALDSENKIDIMNKVGHCGDGYEETIEKYGRTMINVPIMMGDWFIERYLGYAKGIMGGNIWYFCDSIETAIEVGDKAINRIRNIEGVITPFDICSAGSKVECRYPDIGPSTNHPYCPTLRDKIKDSKVPAGIESIPEIVINGITLDAVKEAMKVAIEVGLEDEGVKKISAGNYGGKLGAHKIFIRELL
ncbi:MAG: formylmethanofuran--tetrahydromethanopterin N-formyltransferase [Candidatus Odinarchaeia archaeon]